jgi:hypothetical protein
MTEQTHQTVTEQTVLAASDRNLVEFMCRMARADPQGRISDADGLTLVAAGHPNPGPYRNAALLTSDELSGEVALKRAVDFFGTRSFVLWVRDHGVSDCELDDLAVAREYRLLEEPGLPQLWREGSPEPVEVREGVVLRWAQDDSTRDDFLQVNAEAWGVGGMPLELARRIIFEPGFVADPNGTTFAVVAYLDGKPASTCLTLVHPDHTIGGYWGATAPWALGNHLHDLTTRTVYVEAFSAWPSARHAVCQTSPAAAKTVGRMGFERISTYRRYLVAR